MSMNMDLVSRALIPLVEVLEELGIAYYIGGSVASSAYGISRPTQDADVVADVQFKHVSTLVMRLKASYYVDADMIRDAIRHRSSFNVIYLDSVFKIDIFIPKMRPFAQQERLRAQPGLIEGSPRAFYLSSPEDIILNKLEWYKIGGETSHRQWQDLLAVLKVQGESLDFAYLDRWAENLGIASLLARALAEAGLQDK